MKRIILAASIIAAPASAQNYSYPYGQSGRSTTIGGTTYGMNNDGTYWRSTTVNGKTYYQDSAGNNGRSTTIGGTTYYSKD